MTIAIGFTARLLAAAGRTAFKLTHWLADRGKPILATTLDPFDDDQMLRAFSVTLKNISETKVRLDAVFIRIPEGSELAISWHVPMMIIDDILSQKVTWERATKYSIDQTLDPGEEYDCEIGIPAGFAITGSRKSAVTLAVEITTLGAEERRLIRDIRNIAV
jgi:hypothetical protein